MNTSPDLIINCCKTEKTANNVRLAIPVLIRWAKAGVTTNTYGDLSSEIGKNTFSGIGHVLGYIQDVIERVSDLLGIRVPTLNALVHGKNGLPSYGFEYVYPEYDKMSPDAKKTFVKGINQIAIEFREWDVVLQALGLKPSVNNSQKDEDAIRSCKYYPGGEGEKHNSLKQFIFNHPEKIGLRGLNHNKSEMECTILSGDRLDVYFQQNDGTGVAVEVKAIDSPDCDILRGLYQCVKYKAVLDAQNQAHSVLSDNKVILVLEGLLSESNKQVKDSLGIAVIENFSRQ